MDELDCCGNFADFADTEQLWRALHFLLHQVHQHHPLMWKLPPRMPRFLELHELFQLEAQLLRRGPGKKVFLKWLRWV
jgi:hypothetical protein